MEITSIGVVLIPLGIVFFFARANLLYWCAIFFLPCSATAVLNVGSNGSFSGVQAWMFFGTLWLAHDASGLLKAKNYWYKSQMRSSVRKLLIFLLVALLSLVMPLWIDGRLSIDSADLSSNEARPLFFNLQHVTQLLYLAFGVLFTIVVAVKNLNLVEFRKSVRIFLISSTFVSAWGLVQWSCYRLGVDYPAFLFNTNKNEAAQGYLTELSDLGITRISSVATEPSMLAQFLLIALVFALFAVLGRQAILSTFWDRFALALTLLVLLLTTSSTAYFGLAMLVPIFLVSFSRTIGIRRWHVVSAVVLLVACIAIYARSNLVQDLVDFAIFSKVDSYSGQERIGSVVQAAEYFLRYPVLGVGWGSVTSHDLIFKLLANTGLVGLVAFAAFLKSLASGLWSSAAQARDGAGIRARSYWAMCVLVACLILVITNIFTEFAFVYGHLWFILGLGLAIPLGQSARSGVGFAQMPEARV